MYSSKYQEDTDNFEFFKCITWSPYERIEVNPVKSFKELCKGDSLKRNHHEDIHVWTGVKQCLHLIGISDERSSFSLKDDNKGNYVFNTLDNEKDYDFYCVLSMRFDPDIHKLHDRYSSPNLEKIISNIREEVVEIVTRSLSEDTVCAFFRSLGAEDMVMVFLSSSIKSMMNTIDITKNIQFKHGTATIDLFSTVYMFTGLNNPNCVDEIGADLIVNLHLRKQNINEIILNLNDVLPSKIEYKEIFRGKGTIQLEIPSSVKADILFNDKDGVLNENSEFHKKNFYNSRVYFKVDNTIHSAPLLIDKWKDWCVDDESNKDSCDNVELTKKTDGVGEMSDVARFIFGEYERMIANNRFCQWKEILFKHYKATQRFVEDYMRYDKFNECKLLEQMQSALHLINQACSPASNIPYHNYYSGSFSDLLKAYYGMINMLFNIIYRLPHDNGTSQHNIVFAVRLEAIARIQSEMYTLRNNNDRLIIFSLPYDSFWNYTNNIKLLTHEVFHYAAPYDRVRRNEDIVNIIFKIILTNYSQAVFDKCSNKSSYSKLSQETREWNSYMLNAFNKDDQIKSELYSILHNKYEQFFSFSAPEWHVIFCNNRNLDRIVRIIANSVQDFTMKKAVNVAEHIINHLKKFKLKEHFETTKIKEPDDAMCSRIISTISTLNTAVKEAFCDIWSIKITKISIDEYLIGLFRDMMKTMEPMRICSALAFDYPSLHIRMFSIEIRMYLLLYYDHVERKGEIFDPAAALRNCIKCCKQDEDFDSMKLCIDEFSKHLEKNAAIYNIFRDDLYDMAFRNLSDYFSQTQFTENQEVIELGKIYTKDLTTAIHEDSLSSLVYYVHCSPNKVDFDCTDYECVKTNKKSNNWVTQDYFYESNTPYIISSISDYMACLNDIYRLNKDGLDNYKLWYRGICHNKYSLLPSLFRNCDDSVSLYANQANIMKKAYFNSTASTELWNQPIQQKMASLQHYGVPTNLLDFSLDQFVALYFAVNPDLESDRKAIDDGKMCPVVYAFNPMGYSRTVECLKSGNPNKACIYNLSPVVFDFNQNSEERDKYFVGDMSYENLVSHTNLYNTTDYIPSPRTDLYPVPMVIEHTNPRIKAQSGVFVAYPLDAQPQSGQKGECRYHYVDLLKIQNNYNILMKNCQINGPFLYTIEIHRNAIHSIRDELKQFNINSGKYYPELFKLFENMKN